MISITLPTRTLVNVASASEPYLRSLDGVLDSFGVVGAYEQRPNARGFFDDDTPESPGRQITVFGEYRVHGGDWMALRREVTGLASRGMFAMQIAVDGLTRTVEVRIDGRVTFELIDENGYADFSIPLVAPDPVLYGPWQSRSNGLPAAGGGVQSPLTSPLTELGGGNPGRVTLTNAGSTDTAPEFLISGGGLAGGVELTRIETGQRLRLEWPILPTNVVRFDSAEGQVWLDEQSPITGRLTRGEWWTLGPGETATVQIGAIGTVTGAPQLTARWRDSDA
ncbi:phage tail domain-containing protein [Agromyces sp. NBRC 114283]|uniref:phage tail domain-containing protein n=1 Tax=Agromyces sp. NBRC 114283 TaxID=2994521 RepID=UPI0024A1C3CE|nr:phage tail domain-containing protein [Agromyces sp. NBRC 114283]GLU91354.1 hypothetical protein Agsp01_36090 [Agromyces sp. NBRC 114283]